MPAHAACVRVLLLAATTCAAATWDGVSRCANKGLVGGRTAVQKAGGVQPCRRQGVSSHAGRESGRRSHLSRAGVVDCDAPAAARAMLIRAGRAAGRLHPRALRRTVRAVRLQREVAKHLEQHAAAAPARAPLIVCLAVAAVAAVGREYARRAEAQAGC